MISIFLLMKFIIIFQWLLWFPLWIISFHIELFFSSLKYFSPFIFIFCNSYSFKFHFLYSFISFQISLIWLFNFVFSLLFWLNCFYAWLIKYFNLLDEMKRIILWWDYYNNQWQKNIYHWNTHSIITADVNAGCCKLTWWATI